MSTISIIDGPRKQELFDAASHSYDIKISSPCFKVIADGADRAYTIKILRVDSIEYLSRSKLKIKAITGDSSLNRTAGIIYNYFTKKGTIDFPG